METTEVLIASPIMNPISDPVLSTTPVIRENTICPWGKIQTNEVVSFNDVMSEQLARSLVEEEKCDIPETSRIVDEVVVPEDLTDCCDDFLLAKMMQLEFDKEHDEMLKREETKFNASSKVRVSYGKYKRLPSESISSDEDEEDKEFFLEQSAKSHWHNLEQAEKTFHAVGKSGVSRQGNVTTTKHDLTVSGRRNAGKLMAMSPGISTGDAGDIQISNSVFNTLRMHLVSECKKRHKVRDKREIATTEKALDEKTCIILYKLVNNQTVESISGCISTGKEASVYHAWSALPEEESPSPEFAIKVFKTTLNEFQNRDEYIKDDYRFRYRFSKQNPRKVIHMWAEKEMRNLLRMKETNIPCPQVVVLKKHVLVMSFIGKGGLPAPKLSCLPDTPFEDLTIMFEQTVEILKTLYTECKLVHADFSEYNLLWHEDKVWVIDVSQAVELTHPRAGEFLLRDCTNVSTFFQKKGVLKVPNPEELFFEITGKEPMKPEDVQTEKVKPHQVQLDD